MKYKFILLSIIALITTACQSNSISNEPKNEPVPQATNTYIEELTQIETTSIRASSPILESEDDESIVPVKEEQEFIKGEQEHIIVEKTATRGEIVYNSNFIVIYSPIIFSEIDANRLKNCKTLRIELTEETDLSYLENLIKIEELTLFEGEPRVGVDRLDKPYIESYAFLNNMKNLKTLRISRGFNDFNIKDLRGLDSLEELALSGVNLICPDGYVFENVKTFSIDESYYSPEEIAASFINISTLNINWSEKELDVLLLRSFKKLTDINFYRQELENIDELSNLSNLECMEITPHRNNRPLSDNPTLLSKMTSLKYLSFLEGTFTEEQIEEFKLINPNCEIYIFKDY